MNTDRMRRLRRLSSVYRWSGVPTLRQQSVAVHSYQAIPIALWLAELHARVGSGKRTEEIVMRAVIHDEGEAVYGDPPSPSKRITGAAIKQFDEAKGYGGNPSDDIRNIVKCADCLEALVFCEEEMAMGNASMQYVYDDIMKKFETNWNVFEWNKGAGTKPTAKQLAKQLWEILHLSKHPVMLELE